MTDERPVFEIRDDSLAERMRNGYLSIGEDFREAWKILRTHTSKYFFLMLLVYLPIQVVIQYQTSQMDLTVEAPELILAQMTRLGIIELVMTLLEQVAVLVVAVLVAICIDETQMENKSFSAVFYRGVRMWPRAVLTLGMVALGAICAITALSVLMAIPLLGLLVIPGILLLAILLILLQSCTGTTAALRARMGFDNIRYVFFVLQGRMWRTMGAFALISLLTGVIQVGISFALSGIFSAITQPVISMALQVIISTLTSIISLYGYTVGALLFIGAEYRKEKLLTPNQ